MAKVHQKKKLDAINTMEIYDNQVQEKNERKQQQKLQDSTYVHDYEDSLMNQELERWKKQFSISSGAIDSPKVPARIKSHNDPTVQKVLTNSIGPENDQIDFNLFKKMENEQKNK